MQQIWVQIAGTEFKVNYRHYHAMGPRSCGICGVQSEFNGAACVEIDAVFNQQDLDIMHMLPEATMDDIAQEILKQHR